MPKAAKKTPKKRTSKVRRKQTKSIGSQTFRFKLSDEMLKHLGVRAEDVEAIRTFQKLSDKDRVKASRKVIQDQVIENTQTPDARFALAVAESETLLKGYATLDDPHRSEIQKLIKEISSYLEDETRKRPSML